jgi:hypothetical protein
MIDPAAADLLGVYMYVKDAMCLASWDTFKEKMDIADDGGCCALFTKGNPISMHPCSSFLVAPEKTCLDVLSMACGHHYRACAGVLGGALSLRL